MGYGVVGLANRLQAAATYCGKTIAKEGEVLNRDKAEKIFNQQERMKREDKEELAWDPEQIKPYIDGCAKMREILEDVPDDEVKRWLRYFLLFQDDDEGLSAPFERNDAIGQIAMPLINSEILAEMRRRGSSPL